MGSSATRFDHNLHACGSWNPSSALRAFSRLEPQLRDTGRHRPTQPVTCRGEFPELVELPAMVSAAPGAQLIDLADEIAYNTADWTTPFPARMSAWTTLIRRSCLCGNTGHCRDQFPARKTVSISGDFVQADRPACVRLMRVTATEAEKAGVMTSTIRRHPCRLVASRLWRGAPARTSRSFCAVTSILPRPP